MHRLTPGKVVFHVVLLLGVLISLFPFYWLLVMATGTETDIYAYPPRLIPGGHLIDNINTVRDAVNLPLAFLNTVIVAVLTTALTLFFSSLAGFTFARFRFPGRNVLFVLLLLTMALPSQLGTIPSFVIMSELQWVGTLQALIVPGVAGAFGIFWMRQFALGAIPQDLVDAGRVDGCNYWQLYTNVALPLLRPALAFLGIFTFITTWNDYFWPLIVLVNPDVMTLQVALSQLQGVYETDYAAVMAGTLISTLPLIVIFILGARHFIGNIAAGALKA
ncbi:MAG TPA: carbohydrate ABC transporter permease [Thermomicrobiales bacterium]|jgi:cellobiose transport system permease protein|nr:carbohydrate ABC transporter permease [Thermomicrobiales bacterium]